MTQLLSGRDRIQTEVSGGCRKIGNLGTVGGNASRCNRYRKQYGVCSKKVKIKKKKRTSIWSGNPTHEYPNETGS